MTPQPIVVGVDLGGTLVRVGALDTRGRLLHYVEAPIEARRGPQEGLALIEDLIQTALDLAVSQAAKPAEDLELAGIGIGATGPIDRSQGAIQNPYTLPTWEDVDILTPLQSRFGVPATLENDADAAALGEYWQGAGQGIQHLAVVTVGTGIGTAFVYRGELYRGLGEVHPEGGHQVIDPQGPPCYCGARGCWESLASGTAIGRRAQDLLASRGEGSGSLLWKLSQEAQKDVDARMVAQAAQAGDPLARQVIEEAGQALGLGLVNLIAFFVPEVILLGGGVMKSYPLFQPVVEAVIARHNVVVPARQVELRLVRLGRQAGVIGAGYAMLQLLNTTFGDGV